MFTAEEVLKSLTQKEVPAFHSSLTRLIKELSNKSRTKESLEEIVSKDPVLACRILRLVNGPMYESFGKNIVELDRALDVLGENALYSLLTQIPPLQDNLLEDDVSVKAEYIKVATCVELAKQIITKKELDYSSADYAYTAFQRYGYVALADTQPEFWQTIKSSLSEGAKIEDCMQNAGIEQEVLLSLMLPGVEVGEWVSDTKKELIRVTIDLTDKIYETNVSDSLMQDYADALGIPSRFLETAVEQSKNHVISVLEATKELIEATQPTELSATVILAQGLVTLRKKMDQLDLSSFTTGIVELLSNALETSRSVVFLKIKDDIKAVYSKSEAEHKIDIKYLSCPLNGTPSNSFEVCMASKKMLRLQDPKKIKNPIFWATYFGDAKEVLLLPIFTPQRSLGVIYLDWGIGRKVSPFMTEKIFQSIQDLISLVNKKMELESQRAKSI